MRVLLTWIEVCTSGSIFQFGPRMDDIISRFNTVKGPSTEPSMEQSMGCALCYPVLSDVSAAPLSNT